VRQKARQKAGRILALLIEVNVLLKKYLSHDFCPSAVQSASVTAESIFRFGVSDLPSPIEVNLG
jgi:hypothetical protein